MMDRPPDVSVGAYFYPITIADGARLARSGQINGPLRMPDEIAIARQAKPLFEGHAQPQTYCLPDGEYLHTDWDDSNGDHVMQQLTLAAAHGLSYFIFDSYTGVKNGVPVLEMHEARRITNLIPQLGRTGFHFARMETLESPRVALPIPYRQDTKRGFFEGFAEPNRQYDITEETARSIVDTAISEWENPSYLYVEGRPYLSILMPTFPSHVTTSQQRDTLDMFMETILYHSVRKYNVIPYLVGVMRQSRDVALWSEISCIDAITQYCDLPRPSPAIQKYPSLVNEKSAGWRWMGEEYALGKPFIPSPAVGWDASPRGQSGYTLEEVDGIHPYTPIVVNNSPDQVAQMVTKAIRYTKENVSDPHRLVTIFAWNEITEGATLLPRLRSDGTVDNSYLEAVRDAIAAEAKTPSLDH